MNSRKFEYLNKDIPMLKKEILFRFLFTTFFLINFVWQFIEFIGEYNNKTLNLAKVITTVFVMLFTLSFAILSLLYAFKSHKLIKNINRRGKCVSSVAILFETQKTSLIKLISFITTVVSIVMLLALISIITYSILQFAYFSTISFFLPLLVSITIMGFNSVFHIKNEISIIETVKLYNSIY